jgi:hypothetical protein
MKQWCSKKEAETEQINSSDSVSFNSLPPSKPIVANSSIDGYQGHSVSASVDSDKDKAFFQKVTAELCSLFGP